MCSISSFGIAGNSRAGAFFLGIGSPCWSSYASDTKFLTGPLTLPSDTKQFHSNTNQFDSNTNQFDSETNQFHSDTN